MSINVKIDNSGAGVVEARIGSILFVGAQGFLKEDKDFLSYDDVAQTLSVKNFSVTMSIITPLVDSGSGNLSLSAAGVNQRWNIQASGGHLVPSSNDNAQDLGEVGARVRTGHFGTSVRIGGASAFGQLDVKNAAGDTQTSSGISSHRNNGTSRAVFLQGGDDNTYLFNMAAGHIFFGTNGTTVQLEVHHTASATSYITLTGSSTGAPTISVIAGATLRLGDGTHDIIWGVANAALGGGAAPTFGTIGGGGPAAAAQRNWLRFVETDGTISFIPVWR